MCGEFEFVVAIPTQCNINPAFCSSGGKDSCYSMMQCVAHGHDIVALANLRPKDGG